MQLSTKTSELLEKLCVKQPHVWLCKRCDGVKTHHLSMSPLMTWQDAGTASLESGILTGGSWSWWRCGAAVNSGYRLVTEMEGGREEGGTTPTEHGEPEWRWELIKRQTSLPTCYVCFISPLRFTSFPRSPQIPSFLLLFYSPLNEYA